MRGAGLLTTVVGSYPQPDWLVDRENLKARQVPRVRARDIWRVEERFLAQAQDDATLLALRDMEAAGIDIVTDGEIRRESYSNLFATSLDGFDADEPGVTLGRSGRPTAVPRVVGPVRRTRAVQVRDVEFLRRNTDRQIKITLPGPFTITQQAQNDYYPDEASLAMDVAVAVNAEVKDLATRGRCGFCGLVACACLSSPGSIRAAPLAMSWCEGEARRGAEPVSILLAVRSHPVRETLPVSGQPKDHLRLSCGRSRDAASFSCANWSPPAKRRAMWRAPASIQRWSHSTQASVGPA
jgi:hypothetical protein